jgi:hypothetical protein
MATAERKTYPRLQVSRRDSAWSTVPPWLLSVRIGREGSGAFDWGRYSTARAAWDAAADLLHNHWEH